VRPTVLIVDDDPTVTDHFSRILRLEGYDVAAAYSPEQGLALAAGAHPDALVLDLQMRTMDGVELLGRFREMPHLAHVPAVIVTGDYFMEDEIRTRLESLGAQVQFKPLWVEDLVKVVATLIDRHAATAVDGTR
jgi:CheY-like chemotaxis protein